ncbi:MAG TPA: PH domain-containing protein [Solirubrobacteraceae bacterium]|nr:PH domain-containing protein [Solirubrobacteraceae bacterium]
MRPEPTEPLPPETLRMWFWSAVIAVAVLVAGALVLAASVGALMPWLPLGVAVAGAAYVALVPRVRLRRWRWRLDDEELDIVHGVWRVQRTIVPVTRIQHVSVQRTGWSDRFGLVSLHAYTAAGETDIPGLRRPQADELRDRILAQLRTPDDL